MPTHPFPLQHRGKSKSHSEDAFFAHASSQRISTDNLVLFLLELPIQPAKVNAQIFLECWSLKVTESYWDLLRNFHSFNFESKLSPQLNNIKLHFRTMVNYTHLKSWREKFSEEKRYLNKLGRRNWFKVYLGDGIKW